MLRRLSRLERLVAVAGLVVSVAGVVVVVGLVSWVGAGGAGPAPRAVRSWQVVAAVRAEAAVPAAVSAEGQAWVVQVSYRWRGGPQQATIGNGHRLDAGGGTSIWVRADGRPTSPPAPHQGRSLAEAVTAGIGAIVLAGGGVAGSVGYRRWLARRRDAQWAAEWLQLDPYRARPGH